MKNYYEILDITVDASELEIKKAYFKLVRKYPPDRYEKEFMGIREAYEILSDKKTREQFDSMHKMDPVIKSEFEYAKKLIELDELGKAIKVLEELIKHVPGINVIKILLGETCRRNGNNGKAIKIFEELVKEEPTNAGFAGHLAYSYLERGWQKKAITAFLNALEIDKDNVSFYVGLSQSYMTDSNAKAARNVLKQALDRFKEENEDNTTIYYQLIVSDIILNELVEMEEHLDGLTALALKNEDIKDNIGWTLAQLANQLISLNRMKEARTVLKRAIELLPEDKDIIEIQNEIEYVFKLEQSFNAMLKDKQIGENIKNLISIYYESEREGDDGFPVESITHSYKLGILKEYDCYIKDVKILKEKYPELYNLQTDFFEAVTNFTKRKKMIKELETHKPKSSFSFDDMVKSMMRGLEYDEDDDDDDYDDDYDDDFYEVEQPYVREEVKIGRNDPCSCGSGKKYKKCCGK